MTGRQRRFGHLAGLPHPWQVDSWLGRGHGNRRHPWFYTLSREERLVVAQLVHWRSWATRPSVQRQLAEFGPAGVRVAATIIDRNPDVSLPDLYETVKAVLS